MFHANQAPWYVLPEDTIPLCSSRISSIVSLVRKTISPTAALSQPASQALYRVQLPNAATAYDTYNGFWSPTALPLHPRHTHITSIRTPLTEYLNW